MPNSPTSAFSESSSLETWSVEKAQKDSAITVADIIVWITPTEEFLGQKFVAQMKNLEWEKRDTYIVSVTNSDTMKPLLLQKITQFQIDEKVSLSRVIAFIQANT